MATKQGERALSAGCRAPKFLLTDQDGITVSSTSLLKRGPVVLMFYPGTWYPSWTIDLVSVDQLSPAMRARGAEVVAISQQTAAENLRVRSLTGVKLSILADPGGKVSSKFGVRWTIPKFLRALQKASGIDLPAFNGDDSWSLVLPARFVVDRNGVIVYSEINLDQTCRSDLRGVLAVIDFLHRQSLE